MGGTRSVPWVRTAPRPPAPLFRKPVSRGPPSSPAQLVHTAHQFIANSFPRASAAHSQYASADEGVAGFDPAVIPIHLPAAG